MAVSIMMPREQESKFDKFLRRAGGIAQVASQGLNVYSGLKDMSAKAQDREDAEKGVYKDASFDPKDWLRAADGETEGVENFQVRDGDNVITRGYKRRMESKAKTPEELANIKADTDYKNAQAYKLTHGKPEMSEAESLERVLNKREAVDLTAKTANKISIKNQLDAFMQSWPTMDDDQKLTQGRNLLKILNSSEGADAIGAEEVKRLGSKLEFALGNFTNSNPTQFGRDLDGFGQQVADTSKIMGDAINMNRERIGSIVDGRRGLKQLVENKAPPKDEMVIVSNGKETLQIPRSRLAEAQKDGFNLSGRDASAMARP